MDSSEQKIGDYRITGLLGQDEVGQSYLAEHGQDNEPCVVTVLDEELAKDKHFGERFRGVARSITDLAHKRIVAIHKMSRAEGRYYIAMDYVTGPRGKPMSLREYLAYRIEQGDGTVQEELVQIWGIQIAEALAFAHDCGHRHHWLRPDNVLIDEDNNIQVSGFGLVRAVGEEFLYSRMLTRIQTTLAEALSRPRAPYTGAEPSAYDYLAPEQRYAAQVDERADVYSFGVLLYRMLTGRGPGNFAQPPSKLVDDISPQWDVIVMKCLAENPTDRYPSATALHALLRNMNKQIPVAARGEDDDAVELHVASLEADVAAAAIASAAVAAARADAGDVPQFRPIRPRISLFGRVSVFFVILMAAGLIVFAPKLTEIFTKERAKEAEKAEKEALNDNPDRTDNKPDRKGNGNGGRHKPPKPPRNGHAKTEMDVLRARAQGTGSPAATEARLIVPAMPETPRESAVAKMRRVSAMSTDTPNKIANSFMNPASLKRATANSSAHKAFIVGQDAREPAEKIKHFTKAIELDERYAWAYVQRGFVYFLIRQYPKALTDYTRAIELNGNDYVPYYCRALTFEKLGNKKLLAEHDYKKAEQLAPKNPAWHIQRGNDHAGNGKYDQAISEYSKAIKLNPGIALAYNNRGAVYSDQGKYTEALIDLTEAISLDTNSARAYFNRGLTYLRLKRYDEAIRDNTTVLGMEPRNASAYYNRAFAYEKKGKTAQARNDYDEARNIIAPKNHGERLFD